jgi:hypothetical protein
MTLKEEEEEKRKKERKEEKIRKRKEEEEKQKKIQEEEESRKRKEEEEKQKKIQEEEESRKRKEKAKKHKAEEVKLMARESLDNETTQEMSVAMLEEDKHQDEILHSMLDNSNSSVFVYEAEENHWEGTTSTPSTLTQSNPNTPSKLCLKPLTQSSSMNNFLLVIIHSKRTICGRTK